MKINWKVRIKHPNFWVGLFGVIASPILVYFGLTFEDLTTWQSVGDLIVKFISNPYLVFSVIMSALAFLGVLTDHTTAGLGDSSMALTYESPKK